MSNEPKIFYERQLCWEVADSPRTIAHCYHDQAMHALDIYCGEMPWTLGAKDLPALRAMIEVGGGRPIPELVELIEEHGEIRVWWPEQDRKGREEQREPAASLDA